MALGVSELERLQEDVCIGDAEEDVDCDFEKLRVKECEDVGVSVLVCWGVITEDEEGVSIAELEGVAVTLGVALEVADNVWEWDPLRDDDWDRVADVDNRELVETDGETVDDNSALGLADDDAEDVGVADGVGEKDALRDNDRDRLGTELEGECDSDKDRVLEVDADIDILSVGLIVILGPEVLLIDSDSDGVAEAVGDKLLVAARLDETDGETDGVEDPVLDAITELDILSLAYWD